MSAPAEVLYVRDGSRFVVYDAHRQHVPPIPVPVSLADPEEEGADCWEDPEQPGRTMVRAPKCPHGSFIRWAHAPDPKTGQLNCPGCRTALRGHSSPGTAAERR